MMMPEINDFFILQVHILKHGFNYVFELLVSLIDFHFYNVVSVD